MPSVHRYAARLQCQFRGHSAHQTFQFDVQGLTAVAPKVAKALLYDRDEHMLRQLLKLCKENPDISQPRVIVAVVGLAHLDGLERRFAAEVGSGAS